MSFSDWREEGLLVTTPPNLGIFLQLGDFFNSDLFFITGLVKIMENGGGQCVLQPGRLEQGLLVGGWQLLLKGWEREGAAGDTSGRDLTVTAHLKGHSAVGTALVAWCFRWGWGFHGHCLLWAGQVHALEAMVITLPCPWCRPELVITLVIIFTLVITFVCLGCRQDSKLACEQCPELAQGEHRSHRMEGLLVSSCSCFPGGQGGSVPEPGGTVNLR